MNKLVAGAIAGAAGIALLLGGTGTFALWNGSETVNGGTIQSGKLAISLPSAASWKDISSATPTVFTPASQKVVPGDTLELTQRVTIETSGKNLKGELFVDPTTIVRDPAIASFVTITVAASAVPASGDATISAPVGNKFTITPGTSSSTQFDITVTVAVSSSITGIVAQNLATAIKVDALALTLTQVRP